MERHKASSAAARFAEAALSLPERVSASCAGAALLSLRHDLIRRSMTDE